MVLQGSALLPTGYILGPQLLPELEPGVGTLIISSSRLGCQVNLADLQYLYCKAIIIIIIKNNNNM